MGRGNKSASGEVSSWEKQISRKERLDRKKRKHGGSCSVAHMAESVETRF
jgi:hypothetical protein